MADAHNVLEGMTGDTTGAQKLDELVGDRNMKRALHCLHRVRMIGKTSTKTIVKEYRVSCLRGRGDVRVVWCNFPVSSVTKETVC